MIIALSHWVIESHKYLCVLLILQANSDWLMRNTLFVWVIDEKMGFNCQEKHNTRWHVGCIVCGFGESWPRTSIINDYLIQIQIPDMQQTMPERRKTLIMNMSQVCEYISCMKGRFSYAKCLKVLMVLASLGQMFALSFLSLSHWIWDGWIQRWVMHGC